MANLSIVSIISLALLLQTTLALPFDFLGGNKEPFHRPWPFHHHHRPHFPPFPTLTITSSEGIFPTATGTVGTDPTGTAGSDPTGTGIGALPTGTTLPTGGFVKRAVEERQFFSYPTGFPSGLPTGFPTGTAPLPTYTGTGSGAPLPTGGFPTAGFSRMHEIYGQALKKHKVFEGPRHHRFRPNYPYDPNYTFQGFAPTGTSPTGTADPVPTGTAPVGPIGPFPTGTAPVGPFPTGTAPASSGFPVPTLR